MKKGSVKILVFLFVFSLFLYSPLPATKKAPEINLKGFPEYVEKAMKEFKVPGLAISIVKDGKVIFARGFGFKDVKKGLKVDKLIQVCYDVSNINTKNREIRSLISASKELKCKRLFILTKNKEEEEEIEWFGTKRKIRFIPLWKWLLEEEY